MIFLLTGIFHYFLFSIHHTSIHRGTHGRIQIVHAYIQPTVLYMNTMKRKRKKEKVGDFFLFFYYHFTLIFRLFLPNFLRLIKPSFLAFFFLSSPLNILVAYIASTSSSHSFFRSGPKNCCWDPQTIETRYIAWERACQQLGLKGTCIGEANYYYYIRAVHWSRVL